MLRLVALFAASIAGVAAPGQVLGTIFSGSSDLPQTGWVYRTVEDIPIVYNGGAVIGTVMLSQIQLMVGTPIVRTPFVPDERGAFPSTFAGIATAPALFSGTSPASFAGPADMLARNRIGIPTGTFDTELLALALTGSFGGTSAMIRESPTHASLGRTSIMPPGPGPYQIDSFFDVFTELSVDGGQTWIPAVQSVRVNLVPEPGAWATLAVGLALLGWMVRRRVA